MKQHLFHTPEGVRDIYHDECTKKLEVQDRIHKVLHLYGYRDIQTPTFEYFEIFNKERGSVPSREMFKFFDREGETMVLRPDMTPSIARCIGKYYKDEEAALRLCYCSNTFINNTSYQGRQKETTQMGAELVGEPAGDGDGEIIALIIDCLLNTGLKEFQVELGQVDFFRGLLEEAGMDEDAGEQLRELIENKNYFGVEELLSSHSMDKRLKDTFLKLPELFGGISQLEKAKLMTKNERALKAIYRLEKVYQILTCYGLQDYVSFDLGMLSKYKYYTGIIMKAYTYGTGEMIVTGGRYDDLMSQFGKKTSAVGFAIVIDQLLLALSRQKIQIPIAAASTMVLYENESRATAISLASHFRSTGLSIALMRRSSRQSVKDYQAYASREHIGGILYLDGSNEQIEVINLEEGSRTTVKMTEFMKEVSL